MYSIISMKMISKGYFFPTIYIHTFYFLSSFLETVHFYAILLHFILFPKFKNVKKK